MATNGITDRTSRRPQGRIARGAATAWARPFIAVSLRLLWPGFWPERAKGYLRVGLFGVVVCLVVTALATRSAVADVKEQGLIIGRQLSELKDLLGRSQALVLNGETIHVSSVTSEQDIPVVLDRFEANCLRQGNGLADQFKLLTKRQREHAARVAADAAPVDGGGVNRLGVLREESPFEGMVACLVRAPEQKHQSVFQRLQRFSESQDLGALGMLRYAYARKTPSGRTHVITSWTDGSFRLGALLPPASGDAPGIDPEGIRPGASTRLLTAMVQGAPHSVHIYDARGTPAQVLRDLDRQLAGKGWKKNAMVERERPNTRAYQRRGIDLLVVAEANGERAGVTMIRTGASDATL